MTNLKNFLTQSQVKSLNHLKEKMPSQSIKRHFQREANQLRPISFETNVSRYAEGSCLVKFGYTHVLCTATIEEKLPFFLRHKNQGWITAEYGMLPRSTHERVEREITKGKLSGRTQEIQRLIGRSLRSIVDLSLLGPRQIKIDCDVIQADGGTRTTSISGAYVALHQAVQKLIAKNTLKTFPLKSFVGAVSCGIVNNEILLDLDYQEDHQAQTDANFVLTEEMKIIEIQTTAEQTPYSFEQFNQLTELAKKGIQEIIQAQKKALKISS